MRIQNLLLLVVLSAACTESIDPASPSFPATRPIRATTTSGPGIALDQVNGTMNESGTMIIKGFNPTNPHNGDAIIATFYWVGSSNIIDSVVDVLTTAPFTPVGNRYQLLEYVTSGGISMATYVATNVQNFPDPNPGPDVVLAVAAYLSQSVTDAGVSISAWSGGPLAIGNHLSASGSAATTTTAHSGAVAVDANALLYTVTLGGLTGLDRPAGFTDVIFGSDGSLKADAAYLVPSAAGTIDPQWTWYYGPNQSTWLVTTLALKQADIPATDFITGGGKVGDGREFTTFGLTTRPDGGDFEWVQHCANGANAASAACASGQFTFKGSVTPGSYVISASSPLCRKWSGTGAAKETGSHSFRVAAGCDNGEPGRGADYIDVYIDGYHYTGNLSGGNIQLHKGKGGGGR